MSVDVNKTLFALTNRDTFDTPMFDAGPELFQVRSLPPEDNTRSILRLDIKDTDYYIIGILQAIESFPEISIHFNDAMRTYDLARLTIPEPQSIKCNLIATQEGPPFVKTPALSLPVSFEILFKYVSAKNLKVSTGTQTFQVPYTSPAPNIIYPEWPDALQIRGGIDFESPWNAGNTFSKLTYWPNTFPFDLMADELKQSNEHDIFMLDTIFSAAYYSTPFNIEKVALSAAALGLKNRSVYP